MNSATSTQPAEKQFDSVGNSSGETSFHRATTAVESLPSALGPRRIGYGLPCVKCKTYYAADLAMCPVCKTEERVSPVVAGSAAPTFRKVPCPCPTKLCWKQNANDFCGVQVPGLRCPCPN